VCPAFHLNDNSVSEVSERRHVMSFNIELGGTALCLLLSCSTWASGPGLANDCINQTKSIPAEWKTVIEINGYNCEIDFQRLFNLIYVSHESESLIFAGGCVW